MKKSLLFISCFFVAFSSLYAQDISIGFRTGLNFSKFDGPTELHPTDGGAESFKNSTGFHIGGGVKVAFTDIFGIEGELLYSQKGSRHKYEGNMPQTFVSTRDRIILTNGVGKYAIRINNSYIEVPIMAYVRPVKWISFSAGISAAALISSTASGELEYVGTNAAGASTGDLRFTLTHKYFNDKAGAGAGNEVTDFGIGNELFEVPSARGAYYDFESKDGNKYNPFDVNLIGGVNIYLNSSLYIGAKINYGLVDVTRNFYDRSFFELDSQNKPAARTDKDVNFTYQVSVGFGF